jgi:L-arabinose transport system ATP-binding protein
MTKFKTSETDEKRLVKAMVGRDIGDTYAKLRRNDKMGDVILVGKESSDGVCT